MKVYSESCFFLKFVMNINCEKNQEAYILL